MSEFENAELNSVHYVKILLCYVLGRLDRPVTEKQLLEIAADSEVINYFYYTEALEELIKNGSAEREDRDGETYIVLGEKGRHGADYFKDTVPLYFRRRVLKAAMYYFASLERQSAADAEVVPTENGFEVTCRVKDTGYDLMRVTLYAPDEEQAKLVKEKIMLDPAEFYKNVIGYALENEEERIDIDSQG